MTDGIPVYGNNEKEHYTNLMKVLVKRLTTYYTETSRMAKFNKNLHSTHASDKLPTPTIHNKHSSYIALILISENIHLLYGYFVLSCMHYVGL